MWLVLRVDPWTSLQSELDLAPGPIRLTNCPARGFCLAFDNYEDALLWADGHEDWLLQIEPQAEVGGRGQTMLDGRPLLSE